MNMLDQRMQAIARNGGVTVPVEVIRLIWFPLIAAIGVFMFGAGAVHAVIQWSTGNPNEDEPGMLVAIFIAGLILVPLLTWYSIGETRKRFKVKHVEFTPYGLRVVNRDGSIGFQSGWERIAGAHVEDWRSPVNRGPLSPKIHYVQLHVDGRGLVDLPYGLVGGPKETVRLIDAIQATYGPRRY